MRYCSEDAPRSGERNINLNKNTSENAALNTKTKIYINLYFFLKKIYIPGVWKTMSNFEG